MRLIDADALKEELSDLEPRCANKFVEQGIDDGLHYYMPKILEKQPTIKAEPVKHGLWLFSKSGLYWTCSECRVISLEHTNYCPECGAKMEGGGR